MDNLFNELSERYNDRIVIIDSPPVLSTNEANILAKKTGQIVFVKGKKRYVLDEDSNRLYLICDKCNNSNWETVDDNPSHIKSKCGEMYVL